MAHPQQAQRTAWVQIHTAGGWLPVIPYEQLPPGRVISMSALGEAVAVLRDLAGAVRVTARDPFRGGERALEARVR
ncbi:hypothetical protein BIV57_19585 [Mangrovactinospora gilvigrisea]|uniref:Uncharacterized protein n=1 Tax=Mangrovactinospora gilvigrisea TaxID=1428644 RepID=A0A1J7BB24_9ACTN|nr:hypothetical protein [Mangrovactinospora gilvigrisea]OIV35822.1 hypothetical protein BIV57_19585 [Mangrovactinospora gilvigrisea]